MNAEASANAVFGHVEAEAERRAKEKRHETDARDDQADRMKSEMQGMMRMQQQGMEMIIGRTRVSQASLGGSRSKKHSPYCPSWSVAWSRITPGTTDAQHRNASRKA